MESPAHPQASRHLDATTGREVVYCHHCSHEWHRDEHGLTCPDCESDITEIIDPEHDPRAPDHHTSASTSPEVNSSPYGDHDSDPDEADIEEQFGPHGFHYHRSIRDRGQGTRPHDPAIDPVLERFLGMIQDLTPPRRAAGPGMFRQEGERRYGEPHIHRATFTTGNGNASVTILSGPAPSFFGRGPPGAGRREDPFQSFFNNVLRDVGPPEAAEHGGPQGPAFARGLQEILSLFSPQNAVAGDAVYSQEALDRIITNLMEAHPQSNAAPPASNEALAKLDRKSVDASMLEIDGKTECAICIDDMKLGETAAFLPCKHWFHEECVILWLKEHNTCPVCRASIETNSSGNNSSSANTPQSEQAPGAWPSRSSPRPIPRARPSQLSRPPSQSQSRLNEAMRSISSMQQERERERDYDSGAGTGAGAGRGTGTTSGLSDDTSRLQRRNSRNSLSPTSPRMTSFADYRSRNRQRSPSQSSRRENGNSDSGRQSGSGPFSWFRSFSSRGNSNQDSNRDHR